MSSACICVHRGPSACGLGGTSTPGACSASSASSLRDHLAAEHVLDRVGVAVDVAGGDVGVVDEVRLPQPVIAHGARRVGQADVGRRARCRRRLRRPARRARRGASARRSCGGRPRALEQQRRRASRPSSRGSLPVASAHSKIARSRFCRAIVAAERSDARAQRRTTPRELPRNMLKTKEHAADDDDDRAGRQVAAAARWRRRRSSR